MARNEKTSRKVAKTAAKALKTGKATKTEIRQLGGSTLTQTPDKKRGKGRGKSKK